MDWNFLCYQKSKNTANLIIVTSTLSIAFLMHYLSALVVVIFLITFTLSGLISWIRKNNTPRKPLRNFIHGYMHSERATLVVACSLLSLSLWLLPFMKSDSGDMTHSSWIPETPEKAHMVLLNEIVGYWWWGDSVDGIAEFMFNIVLISPIVLLAYRFILKDEKPIEKEPEWILWAVSLGSLGIIILYSSLVRPLFVLRYFTFSMPAWILLFGVTVSRLIELTFSKFDDNPEKSTIFALLVSTLFMLSGANWITNDYNYYDYESSTQLSDGKSDFKGMAAWLDANIEDNSPYIISQPQGYNWDLYLQRTGSEITVDTSIWGDIHPDMMTPVSEKISQLSLGSRDTKQVGGKCP